MGKENLMLGWLFKRQIDAFDREYGYDSSYLREILDADLDAAIRFSKVMGLTKYRKGIPAQARCAAGLVGTMAEDCGPCTQFGVTMAEREGVAPEVLRAILEKDTRAMPEEVLLAYRFAQAVIAHDPEADPLRERIVERWGKKGLITLGFAITMSRFFPTLKYAMGHGQACSRIKVGGTPVAVNHGQPQVAR
jgi:hypothetical protein